MTQVSTGSNGYQPFTVDDWTLTTISLGEDVSDLTLIELLACKELDYDMEKPVATVSTRCTQPTLTGLIHLLSIEQQASVSKVQRVATKHGLELIRQEPGYVATLQPAFHTRLQGLRTGTYDHDRNARISQSRKLIPTHASNDRDNIQVYWWMHGALKEMAYRVGIYVSYLTMFCILYSIATIPNLGPYTPIVLSDIERLRRHFLIQAGDLSYVETFSQ